MSAPSSDKAAIRQVIRALRKANHTVTAATDGAGETHRFAPDALEEAIIAEVTSCDDGTLHVRLPGDGPLKERERGWIYFVLGNDPEEVVCDHTVNLSPVLDPLTEGWWD